MAPLAVIAMFSLEMPGIPIITSISKSRMILNCSSTALCSNLIKVFVKPIISSDSPFAETVGSLNFCSCVPKLFW